ncbi:hybrid sensor histidine kinase/response regulator [Streptomyces sp. H27-D2]|uniref:hybrid sensor histidine kinase/response regulator n=1 Tax=Streptomyces sp. H27-D2 TaxID=3046304 RepID=UPI002DB99896|nr:PAS domain-containing protein [Streptomyces sp. H27-D2]MEC4018895.1 PAS domain-containing protein [Streptomyces sp. H27-D2]
MSSRPSRGTARLAAILDALPDALLLVNCNGTVVNANTIALEAFETPGTALVGRGLLSLLPAFDSKRIPGSMRRANDGDEDARTKPTRMIARRTDGTEFPVEVTSANLEDGNTPYADRPLAANPSPGNASYTGDELLMLVVRDLTGTLDTEAELARQQRQTEMILRAAAEGVVGVDTDGKVVLVNPSAAQILGYRASDLGGQELHPLVHHTRADGTPLPYEETPLADTLRSGRKHRVRGQVLWSKDGRAVAVDLTTAPVRDGEQLVGAVMTFTDRRPYDELAARHAQLLAVLEDSLRGPLEQLRGELGTLADDPAGQLWPEANQILHHLAAGYTRMTTLVDNVLGYQRLDTDAEPLDRQLVSLDAVVAAGVEGAIELIGPGRAQFAVHAPPIEAEVDAERLAQALAHLIADVAGVDSTGNTPARASGTGDSTIVVAAAQRGEVVRIEVRGPYNGGDPVHEPIVRGIVSRHGGVLQTHDVPGQGGSAYVLEVPVAAGGGGTGVGTGAGDGSGPNATRMTGNETTVMPVPAEHARGTRRPAAGAAAGGAGTSGAASGGAVAAGSAPGGAGGVVARSGSGNSAGFPDNTDNSDSSGSGSGDSDGSGSSGGVPGARLAGDTPGQEQRFDDGEGQGQSQAPTAARPTGRRRGRPSAAENAAAAAAAASGAVGAVSPLPDGGGRSAAAEGVAPGTGTDAGPGTTAGPGGEQPRGMPATTNDYADSGASSSTDGAGTEFEGAATQPPTGRRRARRGPAALENAAPDSPQGTPRNTPQSNEAQGPVAPGGIPPSLPAEAQLGARRGEQPEASGDLVRTQTQAFQQPGGRRARRALADGGDRPIPHQGRQNQQGQSQEQQQAPGRSQNGNGRSTGSEPNGGRPVFALPPAAADQTPQPAARSAPPSPIAAPPNASGVVRPTGLGAVPAQGTAPGARQNAAQSPAQPQAPAMETSGQQRPVWADSPVHPNGLSPAGAQPAAANAIDRQPSGWDDGPRSIEGPDGPEAAGRRRGRPNPAEQQAAAAGNQSHAWGAEDDGYAQGSSSGSGFSSGFIQDDDDNAPGAYAGPIAPPGAAGMPGTRTAASGPGSGPAGPQPDAEQASGAAHEIPGGRPRTGQAEPVLPSATGDLNPANGQAARPQARPTPLDGAVAQRQSAEARSISVRTLGQGVPFAQQIAEQQRLQQPPQPQQPQHPQPLGQTGLSGSADQAGGGQAGSSGSGTSGGGNSGSGRRRKLSAPPQNGERGAAADLEPAGRPRQSYPQGQSQQAQSQQHAPHSQPHSPLLDAAEGRAYAIGAPDEGAEGPEPLDGPNGAIEVVDDRSRPMDDELPPEPLDNPRRLLVWPAPDVSTQQALSDSGYRPVIVHSREEVDAQIAAFPAALFVDPLTGPITRTALQSLRTAAVAAEVPVLVTAGLGQATREAAYGADPAVLLKALAPRDSDLHPPRVLLIEEHEPIATALKATLERRGMQVGHAATDGDAVTLAARMRPNLVVMDLFQVRRRRAGIVDWLRANGLLTRTPLVVYTSADIDPTELSRLSAGETVLFLAERSTSDDVQGRIVDLLAKIGTN